MFSLLTVLTFLPLLGAVILGFVPRDSKNLIRAVAFLATLASLVLALVAFTGFHSASADMQYAVHKEWIHINNAFMDRPLVIGFDLGVDGLSLPLLLLSAIIAFLAVLASWKVEKRTKEYFIWFLILVTGMFGVFVSLDLFLFFLFLEMTLVPMYFLLAIWGGERRGPVAVKFLIYRGLASVGILLAFIGLAYQAANATGTMTMDVMQIAQTFRHTNTDLIPAAMRHGLFLLLFLAILIEEAFVPFHTWLPDAHEQAPAAVSMVLGGVLVKIGAYVLLRVGVGVLPDAVQAYGTWIAALGVINILYGACVAMVQKDWRRLLAFGTISHMGVFLLGVASLKAEGLQGAVFMIVSSGLLAGLLFFLTGAILERTETLQIGELGGLSKRMPVLSGFLLAGALASLGLPGMSGFVSEILSFMGAFALFPKLAAFGTLGIILSAVYLLWAMQRTTFGPIRIARESVHDATAREYIPMVLFLALILLIGVYPAILGDLVNQTLQSLVTRIGG
jgi:NADH-quinone oxidoreductase subunit M